MGRHMQVGRLQVVVMPMHVVVVVVMVMVMVMAVAGVMMFVAQRPGAVQIDHRHADRPAEMNRRGRKQALSALEGDQRRDDGRRNGVGKVRRIARLARSE